MANEISPLETRVQRISLMKTGQGGEVNTAIATTAVGYPTLAAVGSLEGVAIGASIAGVDIPTTPAPTVVAMDEAAHTATMSGNATGTVVGTPLTFTNPSGGVAAGLDGAELRLYQSSYSPSVTSTQAAIGAAEASFPGYAPIVGAFSVGYIPPTNIPQAISQLLIWTPDDATTPQTIGGVWATDGTTILGIWPLNGAVALNSPADELAVVVADAYPAPGTLTQVRP